MRMVLDAAGASLYPFIIGYSDWLFDTTSGVIMLELFTGLAVGLAVTIPVLLVMLWFLHWCGWLRPGEARVLFCIALLFGIINCLWGP